MKNVMATLLLSFLLAWTANISHAETQIYALHHQLAESLLPSIQDVLQDNETASAYNNNLIVNASASSQQKVVQLLQALDTPLRNLMISVRNNNAGHSNSNYTDVSGGIRTGEVYLGAGGPVYRPRHGSNGGTVIESNGLRVEHNRSTGQTSSQQAQKLRVIEGSPAWISAGQDIPYRSYDRWGNPITEYRNADRGFYVTARIIGNRVQLEISTSNDKLSEDPRKARRGVIETQQLHSTVSGDIGEWINLGGITLQDNNSSHSYTDHSSSDSYTIGDIAVQVLPVD